MKYECHICKKKFNAKEVNWNKLECYTKEELDGTLYFHDKCFVDFVTAQFVNENNNIMRELASRANLMLDSLGVDKVMNLK